VKNNLTRVFTVLIDLLAKMTDHLREIAVVASALGVAFLILKARAVGAAMAAVLAWGAALLPLVLIAAALIAMIELYEQATGKDAWDSMVKVLDFVVGKLKAAYKWAKKVIELAAAGAGMPDVKTNTIAEQRMLQGKDAVTGATLSAAAALKAKVLARRAAAERKSAETEPDWYLSGDTFSSIGQTLTGGRDYFPSASTLIQNQGISRKVDAALQALQRNKSSSTIINIEGDADEAKIRRANKADRDVAARNAAQ